MQYRIIQKQIQVQIFKKIDQPGLAIWSAATWLTGGIWKNCSIEEGGPKLQCWSMWTIEVFLWIPSFCWTGWGFQQRKQLRSLTDPEGRTRQGSITWLHSGWEADPWPVSDHSCQSCDMLILLHENHTTKFYPNKSKKVTIILALKLDKTNKKKVFFRTNVADFF